LSIAGTTSGGPELRTAPFVSGRARFAAALALYAAVNVLFVHKYAARARLPAAALDGVWVAFVAVMAFVGPRLARSLASRRRTGWLYAAGTVIAAVAVAFAMSRFDPSLIRVTRAPAIHAWLDFFLRGRFPYASDAMPSAFPVLFLLALPFDWMGDVGVLQVLALPAFAALCWRASAGPRERAWLAMVLLLAAPLFWYEVVTRSELFTNMTLLVAVLSMMERRPIPLGRVGLGVLAGLVLSTRAIVGLAYVVFGAWRFRREPRAALALGAVAAVTFVATWLPFELWDPVRFERYGPFAIQASYVPGWLIVVSAAAGLTAGATARDAERAWARVALVLLCVVGVVFLWALAEQGWTRLLLADRFDISYFAFGHTVLLYGVARGAWSGPPPTPGSGR
jgi:hypothetical protein